MKNIIKFLIVYTIYQSSMIFTLFPFVYEYGQNRWGVNYWYCVIPWLFIATGLFLLLLKKFPKLLDWY